MKKIKEILSNALYGHLIISNLAKCSQKKERKQTKQNNKKRLHITKLKAKQQNAITHSVFTYKIVFDISYATLRKTPKAIIPKTKGQCVSPSSQTQQPLF